MNILGWTVNAWDKPRSSLGQTGRFLFDYTVKSPNCPVSFWDRWGSFLGWLSCQGRDAYGVLRFLFFRSLVQKKRFSLSDAEAFSQLGFGPFGKGSYRRGNSLKRPGDSPNRRSLKTEIFCAHPLPKSRLLRFCPFLSFAGLPQYFGVFPICPFPLSPPFSLLFRTYKEHSRKGSATQAEPFRKKFWDYPPPPSLWETARFTFSQEEGTQSVVISLTIYRGHSGFQPEVQKESAPSPGAST